MEIIRLYDVYGKDRLIGFEKDGKEYTYVRDSQGNVTMMFTVDYSQLVARYEYDIFGNCTVYDENNKVNADPNFIGNINPFRWKGFYYDAESGLYYANGSYYDPTTGLYVDSAPIDGVMENALSNNLDRNGLMCNNILELACNPSTVFNVTELHSDPTYDVTDKFPDWMKRQIKRQERINKILRWYQDLHWGWKLGVGIALLIGAIGFTVATGGGGAGVISVLVQTAIGVGVGVGLYTVGSLMSESFTVEGLADAALNAFLITSATVFISSAVNYIKHLSRGQPIKTGELKECTNQCFIAGTLVHCEDGTKKIEDIEVGDRVLAYDEETGEQSYKEVVRLFRNESKDWTGITVEENEIVSTPGHKYYLPLTKQWVSAKDLKVGNTVLLSNGQYSKVKKTRAIHYETPQITYNFEVDDLHNYYVENGVLVHNKCWEWGKGSYESVDKSLSDHAWRHGESLGIDPTDTATYFTKAKNFADTVVQRRIKVSRLVPGETPNILRYEYLGKYIHMDKYNKIIVSFGIIT